jgi:hypothetical protein
LEKVSAKAATHPVVMAGLDPAIPQSVPGDAGGGGRRLDARIKSGMTMGGDRA